MKLPICFLPLYSWPGIYFQYNSHVDEAAWADGFSPLTRTRQSTFLWQMSDIHSFILSRQIAGEDMYRWKTHTRPLSGAFMSGQSSAPTIAGNDYIDILYGWYVF